ncbi:MAG: HlyC/CorC family transporter [Saprospiraceae bacterium]|nr:HlyC/CorC family transporter [Saprospiraceae bacterium]MBK8372056.1 HlyC/CorC family transporter [Saprospiraceae bacterium]MBK8852666.1 HlyC/CorC family transporter [Saprospiraceae bacterium]MBK9042314.1 HlyC/CorC family transporter [Saprospiraceae bacterium]
MGTIILVIVTILLSAFFSGVEIAYLSANKLSIEVFKNKDAKKGKIITELYNDPKSFLSTLLVGNNIALVMFTILMTSLTQPVLTAILPFNIAVIGLINTFILTIIIILLGEYLPKTLFRIYANELIFKLAYPINFFKFILVAPAWILTTVSKGFIKLFYPNAEVESESVITKQDFEHYIATNVNEEKDIDKEILTNALNLNLIKVRDCMIPRNEIVFVDKNDDMGEIKKAFLESKHSRLVVTDGDIENVVGYVHHQLLLKNPSSIKKSIMEMDYVPEVMNVQDLMYKFIRTGTNIAVVVDEYGSTAGMITLEDILEEIFGEIEDEHDDEAFEESKISDNEYIFSGRLEMGYINTTFPEICLPEGEYVTISGYIVMTHGSIPEQGEIIKLDNFEFEIISVSDTKIETVKVTKLNHEEKP